MSKVLSNSEISSMSYENVRCGSLERLGLSLYILSLSLFTLGVFGRLCSVIVISSWQFFYTILLRCVLALT